jgi:putative ABC transport system permease protein
VSESVGGEQFLRQVGNVGAAMTGMTAVILTSMFMVVVSNLAQSVQERRVEIGVLKAIGCSSLQVLTMVLGESIGLMLVGAIIGLAVAATIIAFVKPIAQEYFPVFAIRGTTILIGFALGAGIGILAGLWPAARALRLSISAALAKDGNA